MTPGRKIYWTWLGLAVVMWAAIGCSEQGDSRFDDAEIHGQQVYDANCSECHDKTNPDLRKQPPRLDGLFQAKVLPSGAPATDVQVQKTIIEGHGTMPAFDRRLDTSEVDDVIKFLHVMK